MTIFVSRRLLKLSCLTIACLLAACNNNDAGKSNKSAVAPAGASAAEPAVKADVMLVTIKPEMAANFTVGAAEMAEISIPQRIAGRIEVNDQYTTRIGSAITGRVTEVLAAVGDHVKRGQALARLASPELTNAQLAYLRAVSGAKLAERSLERAEQLILADVIGNAELQRREVELSTSRAEMRAAADQLKLIGMSSSAIERLREVGALTSEVTITATRNGVVVERKVSQGQVAQPGDPLFTVADLSNVWVVGSLPEQDAGSVRMNQQVEVEVPALENAKLSGKIVFVSDTVNADTRTIAIRTEVANPKFGLKPQMLATLVINSKLTRQLSVPTSAVVRENDRDHVFIKVTDTSFRLTAVELEEDAGAFRRVKKGLAEGNEIVVAGAFHLNNERKRAELE